ncbi:MAG TPA: AI-2E family transporter [Polyangiaceae bacterium]|nr:AI-2E family transporter [Polyangiaceae bacterium]
MTALRGGIAIEPIADIEAPPVDAEHMRAREARRHYAPAEARALGAMALIATAALLWIVLPVGIGVLLGALLAFTVYPLYRRVARRLRRPVAVALGATIATSVVVGGTLGALVYVLVMQGVSIFGALPQSFAPGGSATSLVHRLAVPLALIKLQPGDIADKLRGAAGGIAESVAGWAAQMLSVVFDGLLALFFMALTMFYVLVRWRELTRRAEHLMPINPHHTRRLVREVARVGRQTVIGNFGTALIQGSIAGLGYALARLPEAAFFAAITAVAALVPAFGTLLVWVPAGVWLLLDGRPAAAAFVLIWGSLAVVGFCDYVVRPRLVGRGESMSTWTTFVALFGGIKLFGFVGFLLGPLIAGVAVSALRLYERARRFRLGLS